MPFPFAIWRKNFVYVENNLERYLRHLSKHFKVEFFFNSTGYQILITYHDHNLTYFLLLKVVFLAGISNACWEVVSPISIIVRQEVYVVAYVRHYLHSFSMSHEGLKTLDHRHNLMYVLLLPESLIFSE